MTTVDIFGIKERIVSILKADTTNLWDSTPSSKTKFRKIEAGSPSPKAIQEPPLPRLWVTSDDTVAIVRPLGVIASNISKGEEYEIRIKILFVVEAKDGPATEEDIDDFTKSIINQLEANYDLRTDGGAESTRVAESSQVTSIQNLPGIFRGDRVRGRSIHFKVIVRA
mgnify:FL=1|jgi:hypothetical protein|tara:strand:+ start:194 stop:697 length:504 start_codon:yes stop_codon:yes gene_type:complete